MAPAHSNSSASRVPKPPLWLLVLMMGIGPFGDTEYTPAMPAMAQSLGASYGTVQLTMTAYLVGSAVSQLAYGPLADRFGRRPVMLWSTLVLIAGLVLSMLSFNIWPLIAGRLVQGIGACAGGVVADAMVRDAFAADQRQRIYAKINAAFALAPAIGPIAGTYVAGALGWHANFGLLAGLAVMLLFLVWRMLPETRQVAVPDALQPRELWSNYREILANREFTYFSLIGGAAIGVVYSALIGGPDLVVNVFHRGSTGIVEVSAAILVAFVIGAGACAALTPHVSHLWMIGGALALMLIGAVGVTLVAVLEGAQGSLLMFLLPIGVSFAGVGAITPVTTARAMEPFKENAGAAASLLGFIRMGVAALATVAMSTLSLGTTMDIPIVFMALTVGAIVVFALYLFGARNSGADADDGAEASASA